MRFIVQNKLISQRSLWIILLGASVVSFFMAIFMYAYIDYFFSSKVFYGFC